MKIFDFSRGKWRIFKFDKCPICQMGNLKIGQIPQRKLANFKI